MFNLITPMAGAGSRFVQSGVPTPKPLMILHGKPFFVRSVQSLTDSNCTPTQQSFVVLKSHITEFNIDQVILDYFPNATVISLDRLENGPVYSVQLSLMAIRDKNIPIIVNDCDHYFQSDGLRLALAKLVEKKFSAGVLTFKSSNPNFSYVQSDQTGRISSIAEKKMISDNAVCGAYLFQNLECLQNAINSVIAKQSGRELFMSDIIADLASSSTVLSIPCAAHISFGTPSEYRIAQDLTEQLWK